jgi:hypothetical protein
LSMGRLYIPEIYQILKKKSLEGSIEKNAG